MSKLNISDNDMAATARIAAILKNIEENENNFQYANTVTDELYRHQPFILSMIMGYKMDLSPEEFGPLVKLYITIWEYYKSDTNVRDVSITQEYYEKVEDRNMRMLNNFEKTGSDSKHDFLVNDLNKVDSKALLAAVFLQFRENKALRNMNIQTKGMLMIGLKSVIQCFDQLSVGSQK